MFELINFEQLCLRAQEAVDHFEQSAPDVSRWADALFVRLTGDWRGVTLVECWTLQALCEAGTWEQPNYAANRIFKLRAELGQPTTGLAGF